MMQWENECIYNEWINYTHEYINFVIQHKGDLQQIALSKAGFQAAKELKFERLDRDYSDSSSNSDCWPCFHPVVYPSPRQSHRTL